MSYEAVVLAAGLGNGVRCLIGNSCKALLPVGGLPIIYYPIRLLRVHGIARITLIVLETFKSDVQAWMERLFPDAAAAGVFEYLEQREEDAHGTMDALRDYGDRARADNIVIISGDLLCDTGLLRSVTDVHDKRLCPLTMLLSNRTPLSEQQQKQQQQQQQPQAATPGGKVKSKPDRDLIGLAPAPRGPHPPATSAQLAECNYVQGEHRVVFMQGEADLGRRLPVHLASLQNEQFGHCLDFLRCLLDAHLYILRRDFLHTLCVSGRLNRLAMFKGECLPHIVNSLQFSQDSQDLLLPQQDEQQQKQQQPQQKQQQQQQEQKSSQQNQDDRLAWPTILNQSDSYGGAFDVRNTRQVFAFVLPADRLCLRVNNLPAYAEANRALLRSQQRKQQQQQQIQPINPTASIADGAVIKRSFIGANCTIGANSRLADCVLMDGASVGGGANLTNSILCSGSACQDGCTLRDCIVEADCSVNAGSTHAAEVISDADFAT
ncbi:hypothetical protein BOX15_Mlig026045g1 [Macrostomum lignano]|uniref:Translation initiation factor eIF2B subunit gamma n=1 Tax=Macrostomum lignano TaxID=282301 RepID=A0A267GTS0_9PLAT|nr:hypothetical protein BOX15_Mlig026045g1 [Macrostomum lignano]